MPKKRVYREKNGIITIKEPPSIGFIIFYSMISCLFILTMNTVIGWVFFGTILLVSGLFGLSSIGVKFDPAQNRFREFTSYYGLFETGKWRSMEKFPFLTILKITERTARISSFYIFGSMLSSPNTSFKLVILSKTHRTKIQVLKFDSVPEAKDCAAKIFEKTGMKLVKFDPKPIRR